MIRVLDSAGSTLVEWGLQQQQQHELYPPQKNVKKDWNRIIDKGMIWKSILHEDMIGMIEIVSPAKECDPFVIVTICNENERFE